MKFLSPISKLSFYCLLAVIGNACLSPIAQAAPAPRIDNQATSVYQDPTDPSKPLTAVSETISIFIQEVAGITVKAIDITRQDGGNISDVVTGTVLFYNYEVQNIGTDTTRFFVPDQAQVNSIGTLQKLQYFDGQAWQDVPAGGYTSNPMLIGGRLPVRVVVTVNNAIGKLTVSLGNSPNDGQNQARAVQAADVYTVDAADDTVGEFDGAPANGVREAQSTQFLQIGGKPEALPRIDLTIDRPFNPTDNTIGFNMKLQVLATLPPNFSGVSPTDLTGLAISLDGRTQTGILVANAIPLGSEFRTATAPSPEWIPIYAYGDPIGPNERADRVVWSTTKPTAETMAKVRRVGFFRPNYRLAKGTALDGFKLSIEVVDLTIAKIYDIAQVFGSAPADPNNSNDITPTAQLIYDESGDEQPSNYNYDGQPAAVGYNGQAIVNPGIVDPKAPDPDPRSLVAIGEARGSSSLGSADGEFIIASFPPPVPPSLKNGPNSQPRAIGPTNDNDDFTNKSTVVNGTGAFDPPLVPFDNTVINSSSLARDVKIIPTVDLAIDLPTGTTVTLSDPADTGRTATFKYSEGSFVPIAGSPAALVLSNVGAGATKNYSVFIDLPAGTEMVKAFPLKLVAFIDTNNNNRPDSTETQNATIDRAYTGFMQVVKESRILALINNSLQPVDGEDGKFSIADKSTQLDHYIEYRISYRNISTPASGTGNRTISATNFGLIEDGTTQPNNWANFTQNDPNSAIGEGTITYSNAQGPSTTTDPQVTKYEVKLTKPVDPAQSGTFTFRRRVK